MTLKEIEELAGHRQVPAWVVKLVGDALAAQKKDWVGISEEQYEYIRKTNGDDFYFFAYAIEQDLKEKNT